MYRARFGLLPLLFALFSLATSAQIPQTQNKQKVDEIIARHLAAEGGAARLQAQNTVRITGYADGPGFRAEFMEAKKRPNRLRRELRMSDSALVEAYDGEKGWQLVPGKSGAEPVEGSELKSLQEDVDFDGPLVDYQGKGNKVELVGKEKFAGADAYNLRVTLASGAVRNYYLNAESFLGMGLTGRN